MPTMPKSVGLPWTSLAAALLLVTALLFAALPGIHGTAGKTAPTELRIGVKTKVQDCARRTMKGDRVSVHYTGTLFEDGTQFDSSIPRGQPFSFTVGAGQVIRGWDQGLLGMCEGEKRKLTIPYDLAYGENGSPPTIPARAALVFEDLLKIENAEPVVDARERMEL